MPFRFIDLFAGIGGLRSGFDKAGGECVFTSEINAFSQRTYAENFPDERPVTGDIRSVSYADIPDHEVLLAGFPCQPFSISGVSKNNALGRPTGFADKARGTLFFEVAEIIRQKRPRAFLLENVKNLLSHDGGNTFRVIRGTLDELGYDVHHSVISAKHWVPQNRQRIYIVGFRKDVASGFRFTDVEIPMREPTMRSVLHPEDGSEAPEPPYTHGPDARVSDKYTLSDKLWGYLQNYADKHREAGNGFGYGIVGPDDVARTLSARYGKDGSEILVRQEGRNPRRLTPRECARLMGFDDPRRNSVFAIPVSDSQAYKQFGNAVCPPVSAAIARAMMPWIMRKEQA